MHEQWKKIIQEYFSQSEPQRLRYNVALITEIVALIGILLIEAVMGYENDGLIVIALLIIYLSIMAVLGNRFRSRLPIFTVLIIAPVTFIACPYMFLFAEGGGIQSGMPVWLAYGMICIFMMLDGIYFAVMMPLAVLVNIATLAYGYYNQHLFEYTNDQFYYYSDNLIAILVVTFAVGIILKYQRSIEKRQKESIEKALIELELEKVNAQRANEAKTHFLANMSHDIRTPMNAIVGMTDIAGYHIDNKEKVQECLSKIKASSTQLLNLLNNVLDMSEIESRELKLKEIQFDLEELVEDVQLVLTQTARNKKVDFHVSCEIGDRNLIGDAVRLRQVLMNIISNSIKYTEAFGHVNVHVTQVQEESEDYAAFDFFIEDNGVGMSQEFADNLIFQPFTRDNAQYVKKTEGSGIGMSITKSIVDAMGANMRIESKVGEGTRFFVHIRLKKDKNVEKTLTKEQDGSTVLNASGKNLLVVEDNEINMEIIQAILERTKAHVVCAWDAEEAIDIISRSQEDYFDLVLMDIQLPGMDGYSAAKTIRSMSRDDSVSIPIIAMTANAFAQDVEKAFQSGMNAHIAKPIDVDELFQKMYHFLYT
jgi:Signal transduction histidine kinase